MNTQKVKVKLANREFKKKKTFRLADLHVKSYSLCLPVAGSQIQ